MQAWARGDGECTCAAFVFWVAWQPLPSVRRTTSKTGDRTAYIYAFVHIPAPQAEKCMLMLHCAWKSPPLLSQKVFLQVQDAAHATSIVQFDPKVVSA